MDEEWKVIKDGVVERERKIIGSKNEKWSEDSVRGIFLIRS